MKNDETAELLREVLLEIEWLSRGKVSRDTLKRINELARDALRPEQANHATVRSLRSVSERAQEQ